MSDIDGSGSDGGSSGNSWELWASDVQARHAEGFAIIDGWQDTHGDEFRDSVARGRGT